MYGALGRERSALMWCNNDDYCDAVTGGNHRRITGATNGAKWGRGAISKTCGRAGEKYLHLLDLFSARETNANYGQNANRVNPDRSFILVG